MTTTLKLRLGNIQNIDAKNNSMSNILNGRKKIKAGFVLSFFLLITCHIFLFLISEREAKKSKAVFKAQNSINQTELIKSTILDAQTEVQGFELSGDDRFLEFYDLSRDAVAPAFDSLRKSMIGDSNVLKTIDSLQQKTQEKIAEFARYLHDYKPSEGHIRQKASVPQDISKNKTDSVQKFLKKISNYQKAEEKNKSELYENSIAMTRNTIILSFFLVLLTLCFAIFVYLKEAKQNIQELEKKIRYKSLLTKKISQINHLEEKTQNIKKEYSDMDSLVKSVLHDARNPLNNISLATHQLKNSFEDLKELEMLHSMIITNVEQVNKILTNMLNLPNLVSRKQRCSVNELLEDTLLLARDRINLSRVKVFRNMEEGLPNISLDYDKVKSALLNFIINAIEAMPVTNGILLVSTCKRMDVIIIVIEDNGKGIDESILNNIFTPYFTLKDKGLGLGLPSARYIIQKNQGKVVVKSIPEKGTTVHVFFRIN